MPYEYECFQKDQLIKELLLIENHLAVYPCPHCLRKHTLTVKALAEETLKITPIKSEQDLMKKIINLPSGVTEIRNLRKVLMSITPTNCNLKPARICRGKFCLGSRHV